MKKCLKCNKLQSVDLFTKDKQKSDGLYSYCKSCKYGHNIEILANGFKKCNGCSLVKLLNEFGNQRAGKNGKRSQCKLCISQQGKIYKTLNKETLKEYRKNYYTNNLEKVKNTKYQWVKNNQDKVKEIRKRFRDNNKEQCNEKTKQWKLNNSDKIRNYNQEYANNRYANDIQFKLTKTLRNRLTKILKGKQKSGSAIQDLGCSVKELKLFLENKFYSHPKTGETMAWNNWSSYGWHIDHIKPLSSFNLTDRAEFLKACHYTNLQPLWAEENLKKSDKLYV